MACVSSFTCHPHTNHTCLYSPAAERHTFSVLLQIQVLKASNHFLEYCCYLKLCRPVYVMHPNICITAIPVSVKIGFVTTWFMQQSLLLCCQLARPLTGSCLKITSCSFQHTLHSLWNDVPVSLCQPRTYQPPSSLAHFYLLHYHHFCRPSLLRSSTPG